MPDLSSKDKESYKEALDYIYKKTFSMENPMIY